MNAKSIFQDVEKIREKSPLIHNITNYVVMNTTANALLALGASPVMAHAAEEVEEMVALAGAVGGALVINIGTLSKPWIDSMAKAMRKADSIQVPIAFDPVGAGATKLRTDTCRMLLDAVAPTVIRGNASEIMALLHTDVRTKGVDSRHATADAVDAARALAEQYRCVVCISGAVDVVTDGKQEIRIANGHPLMPRVTGLGCTATALIGAFLAVNRDALTATAHAMAVMGIAGELAAEKSEGPGTLQLHFYDALYALNEHQIEARLK
ncbi:MAG: hydroxyethylthiazole kinase [candidate division KSB1 bacterium]|nr:hydroxyethylthiazole kinase [candidate division KSB1 bacterium]MDZ7345211.1 hydroxyethylthiazole kinase [candidate division KSB1 bacterium]